MKKLVLIIIMILFSSVAALPDENTEIIGKDCSEAHHFTYNYIIEAPKGVKSNEEFSVKIKFEISGSSDILRSEREITAYLTGEDFTIDQEVKTGETILWLVTTERGGILNLKTELKITDDQYHRNYTVTYRDNFSIEIKIGETGIQTISEEIEISKPYIWYLVRTFGFVGYLLLSLSVLLGIGRFLDYKNKYHCEISELALIFTFLHGILNIFDNYKWNINLSSVFIPRISSVGLGVLGFYFMLILVFTSFRSTIKKLRKNWRIIHYISYAALILSFVHILKIGTDMKNPYIWILTVSIFVIVVLLTIYSFFKRLIQTPIK